MEPLEAKIQEIKTIAAATGGHHLSRNRLQQQVDELISAFYDDIGEIKLVPLRALFDLFLLKTLYVERRSRDLAVLDYLSEMLARFLWTRELFPLSALSHRFSDLLVSLLRDTTERRRFQNLFEAYRKLADTSLFITGVFPSALARRRVGGRRWREMAVIDRSYYVELGRRYYYQAANHELAEWTGQRPILGKLSTYFEVYMEGLNETSQRYIMGFDMNLIADKMLDNINLYRRSGDPKHLEAARKYAALLKVDEARFSRIFRRWRPRYAPLFSEYRKGEGAR